MEQNRDINLIIEDFKHSIVDTVNQSGLPIGIVYYVMKDIMNELVNNYETYIENANQKEQQNMVSAAMNNHLPAAEQEDDSINEDN